MEGAFSLVVDLTPSTGPASVHVIQREGCSLSFQQVYMVGRGASRDRKLCIKGRASWQAVLIANLNGY